MEIKNKKILIVAAHPDDEVLGCGGTLIKLKKNNKIKILFMTDGVSSRGKRIKEIIQRKKNCLDLMKYLKLPKPLFFNFPDNQMDKVPLLKIVKKIEKILKSFKPEIIFTHYYNCLNVDHQITFKALNTAARPVGKQSIKKILCFEIPSSSEWILGNKSFKPNYYINITGQIEDKIKSLKFYENEIRKFPHSRSIEGVRSIAKFRGLSCGLKYAEGFLLVRNILK